jgi:hypothetical protein
MRKAPAPTAAYERRASSSGNARSGDGKVAAALGLTAAGITAPFAGSADVNVRGHRH